MHPQKKEKEKRNEPRPCSKRSTSAAKQTKRSLYTCLRLRESGAKREKRGGGGAWPGGNLPLSTVCGSYHKGVVEIRKIFFSMNNRGK